MGESRIDEQIEKTVTRARKVLQKQVDADAASVKNEIEEVENEGG
jgi:hypothetical protein